MREVTVSKGLLRCGECNEIFDSSQNLSTTMQAPFVPLDIQEKAGEQKLSVDNLRTISALDDWQTNATSQLTQDQVDLRKSPTEAPIKPDQVDQKSNSKTKKTFSTKGIEKPQTPKDNSAKKGKFALFTAGILALLLISQVAFNYRHLFLDTLKYEPKKIQMLNHNVFAHPIEKNVLLISASIKNTADFDQSFPILEVRLTNAKAELVALRRFSPAEYLDNYSEKTLLTKNRATSIKLKIQDPGSEATRFQFDFL